MITIDLFETIQDVWHTLCADFDITSDLPDMAVILDCVDPSRPNEAAQVVLVNLLSEAMEHTSRFSPWYKQPASVFGVELELDEATHTRRWVMTGEALHARRRALEMLATTIEHNKTVILATRFLNELDPRTEEGDPCRTATCQCDPPRTILIHNAVVGRTMIICDACRQPFT
jgi:hypothetical protein